MTDLPFPIPLCLPHTLGADGDGGVQELMAAARLTAQQHDGGAVVGPRVLLQLVDAGARVAHWAAWGVPWNDGPHSTAKCSGK